MALRNGDYDWLGLCLINQVGYNPFALTVPPVGAAYNESPAVTVSIPVKWIPYVIGALSVLEDESIWEADSEASAQEAVKLISAIITGESVTVPSPIESVVLYETAALGASLAYSTINVWAKRSLNGYGGSISGDLIATHDGGDLLFQKSGIFNLSGYAAFYAVSAARVRLVNQPGTVLGQSVSYGGAGTERAVFVPFDFNIAVAAGQIPYRTTLQGIANQSGSNRAGYPSGYGTLEIFTLVKVIRLADA